MTPAQERLEELAALCAVGAATASERAELDAMAAHDPDVRDFVRGYADSASLLALDLVPLAAPAGALDAIRRRVVPSAGGQGGGFGPMPGPGADVIPLASRRRAPTVVAVVIPLAAAAAFAFLWAQERGKGSDLAGKVTALELQVVESQRGRKGALEEVDRLKGILAEYQGTVEAMTTPELKLATMKSPKGEVVKILIDPLTGNWYVMAFQLPPVADKDYQLWFLDKKPGAAPIPSEVLRPGSSNSLHVITKVPAGVEPGGAAISLEPKGGSPTGKPTQVIMGGGLL